MVLLDLGHLTFQGGEINVKNSEEEIFQDAKVFLELNIF
jgi:hypothetical protein